MCHPVLPICCLQLGWGGSVCPLLRNPVLKELPLLSGRDRRPILGVSEGPQRPPWQRAHLIQRASQVRAARSHYGEKTMGLGEAVTPLPGFASSLLLPHSGELTQQQLYGVGAQPVPGQRRALEPSLALFLGGPHPGAGRVKIQLHPCTLLLQGEDTEEEDAAFVLLPGYGLASKLLGLRW